jgi:putative addiction module component (TIGR02574 family)
MQPQRKFTEILEEARGLPYGERAELIEQLIAAAAKDLDPAVEKAWGDEVQRRIKEIEEGKVKGIPLNEALARVRKTVGLSKNPFNVGQAIKRGLDSEALVKEFTAKYEKKKNFPDMQAHHAAFKRWLNPALKPELDRVTPFGCFMGPSFPGRIR